jgi:ribosome-binding protein aMBF1 (putative translation factor)
VIYGPKALALTSARYQVSPFGMPICKGCGEEVDELTTVRVGGKTKKLCEDCADAARADEEIAEASESAVQQMMEYKGRR